MFCLFMMKIFVLLWIFSASLMIINFVLFPKRKGKFLHPYENYGATSKDIADWLKK